VLPGLGKGVRDCAGISARDPSRDLLRLLARLEVISSHRSHAGRQVESPPLGTRGRKSERSLCARAGTRRIRPHTRDLRPRTPSLQNRQLELDVNRMRDDETAEVEAALRQGWVIEEKKRKR
jgi:hypothetical protein